MWRRVRLERLVGTVILFGDDLPCGQVLDALLQATAKGHTTNSARQATPLVRVGWISWASSKPSFQKPLVKSTTPQMPPS